MSAAVALDESEELARRLELCFAEEDADDIAPPAMRVPPCTATQPSLDGFVVDDVNEDPDAPIPYRLVREVA